MGNLSFSLIMGGLISVNTALALLMLSIQNFIDLVVM